MIDKKNSGEMDLQKSSYPSQEPCQLMLTYLLECAFSNSLKCLKKRFHYENIMEPLLPLMNKSGPSHVISYMMHFKYFILMMSEREKKCVSHTSTSSGAAYENKWLQ